MKRASKKSRVVLIITLTNLLINTSMFAQVPQKLNYQAIIRDVTNHPVMTQIGMQISIIQGTVDGTIVYTETQTPTPDTNGLVSIEIGTGTTSDDFSAINWANGPYFIKSETDPTGGTNYTIARTSQLLSVPYALHAETVQNELQDLSDVLSQGEDAGYNAMVNISQLIIGTQSLTPDVQLQIQSDNNVRILLEADADNSGGDDNPRIQLIQDGGLVKGGLGYIGSAESIISGSHANAMYLVNDYNSDLQFGTNNTSRITIKNNGTIDVEGNTIINLADPVDSQDAVPKSYIDAMKVYINPLIKLADLVDLIAEGMTISELFDIGLTISDLLSAGISISDLFNGGVTVSDLLAAGLSVSDLYTGGVPVSELYLAGIPVPDLLAAGISVSELLTAEVTVLELFNAKIGVGTLEENGVTEQVLTDAGLIGTVTDVEGTGYKWIKIGTQIWMAENLKTTKYSDVTDIPYVNSSDAWAALTETSKAYCWYNDDIGNKETFGALYTWAAAMNGAASSDSDPSGIQGVCPTGWHLPSDAEWHTLILTLDADASNYSNPESWIAGGMLKETGTDHWISPNTGATNESGFTALPGGSRSSGGYFSGFGMVGYWWQATEISGNETAASSRHIWYNYIEVIRLFNNKRDGLSVRCLKD